jgi:copper ion binding protein
MSTDQTGTTHVYTVADMSCDHCKRAIEDRVGDVSGVELVRVDLDAKTVSVSGGEPSAIEQAITEAGYTPT